MDPSIDSAPGPILVCSTWLLVAAASFVEITSDLYASNFAAYFAGADVAQSPAAEPHAPASFTPWACRRSHLTPW
jgi:hypothetical protein